MDANITTMYDNLTYYDQYGGSLILFVLITLVVAITVSYFHTLAQAQTIIDDWPNQRCKPNIIPIAGLLTHPEGVSASEYTAQNFAYCTQNILSSITGTAVQPLTFVTQSLQQVANGMQTSIQSSRAMFDKVRTSMQSVTEEIMGRLMNVMTPLIQIIISFRDLVGKIQGTMTAGLFTLLGSYYTLKSLMGSIAQFLITILIALSVMIASFWAVPFTWGAAIANTSIFVAISIPLAVMLAFMTDTLKISTRYKIPKVKCFDRHTLVPMHNGTHKPIADIRVGDLLCGRNEVTAVIRVTAEGSTMYWLDDVLVSDSHIVQNGDTWIKVSDHPHAIQCAEYADTHLYCLNTTHKVIVINHTTFADWDDLYDHRLRDLLEKTGLQKQDIHRELDHGFAPHTTVRLKSGAHTRLNDVCVNDVLLNGEKVYGVVQINGVSLSQQYSYHLGETVQIEGRFASTYPASPLPVAHTTLYHLLTDTGTFPLETTMVHDYNAAVDRLLAKKNET